ncbi:MAG: DUF5131 family protein [Desulfobacterales bacterium]
MNNVKDSIGWCDFTWNPVTGCKRNCSYCYARKINNRFNKTPFSEIVFHPERLKEPYSVKKRSKIFVGSMSDIEYWNRQQIIAVINVCEICKHHTFMFLSKSIKSYLGITWPENTMQGFTVTQPGWQVALNMIISHASFPRPYISIEPISGGLWNELPKEIELVIVGAETGNRKVKIIPQKEWIQSIKDHVPEEKIYWKKNIQAYL